MITQSHHRSWARQTASVGLAAGVVCILAAASVNAATDLLVGDLTNDKILLFDGETGASIGGFVPAGSGGLDQPRGMTLGPDGRLYVSSYSTNEVKVYGAANGAFIANYVTAGSGGLDGPDGLCFGPDGNLYVSSFKSDQVLRYQGPDGASPGAFIDVFVAAGSGSLDSPRGLIFGHDDYPGGPASDGYPELLVCSFANDTVLRYNGQTNDVYDAGDFVDIYAYTADGPSNLIMDAGNDPGGNLYVACLLGDVVQRYSGSFPLTWFDNYASAGGLKPYGLAWGPDGNGDRVADLYVASSSGKAVYSFSGAEPNTPIATFVAPGSGGLTLAGYLLFTCGGAPAPFLDTVQNDHGLAGDTDHTIRIIGADLAAITDVQLVKTRHGEAVINSTSVAMDGPDLLATFNLAGAEGGRYDVVPSGGCALANVIKEGFLVYMPDITNGSFEVGWTPDSPSGPLLCAGGPFERVGDQPKPMHWDISTAQFVPESGYRRDGTVWVVCGGLTDQHHATLQEDVANQGRIGFFQTIAAPNLVGNTSVADYDLAADMAVFSCQQSSLALIRVLDGAEDSTILIDEEPVFYTGWQGDHLVQDPQYSVSVPTGYVYQSNPPILTIEFRHELSAGDECPGPGALKAIHVDNVRGTRIAPPTCNTPPQDVDGDGDVDVLDFTVFQACFNGPDQPWPAGPYESQCECLDSDDPQGDGDVDVADFVDFQACFNGPDAPPAC